MDVGEAIVTWFHSLATVFVLGYYALLAFVVVPVLRRTLDAATLGRVIPEIERRALPLILGAVVVFVVTGAYLLGTDAQFQGLGHAFVNTWSTLIVIKHAVVIVLVGIGVYIDLLVVPDIERPVDAAFQAAAVRRLARSATAIALLGAVVLLLTAAAQSS